MDVTIGSPSVPEETASEADKGGQDGGWETAFWDWNIVVAEGGALIVGILEQAGQEPEKETEKDR